MYFFTSIFFCIFFVSLIFFFQLHFVFFFFFFLSLYNYNQCNNGCHREVILVCISKDSKENYRAMQNRRIDLHYLFFVSFFSHVYIYKYTQIYIPIIYK